MSKRVKQILKLCEKTGIVIVSHGLAPNPFGFCFERGEQTKKTDCKKMNDLLDGLSGDEETELKSLIFRGAL